MDTDTTSRREEARVKRGGLARLFDRLELLFVGFCELVYAVPPLCAILALGSAIGLVFAVGASHHRHAAVAVVLIDLAFWVGVLYVGDRGSL